VIGERLDYVLEVADDSARTAAVLASTLVRNLAFDLAGVSRLAPALPGFAIPTPDCLVRERSGEIPRGIRDVGFVGPVGSIVHRSERTIRR
jgi:hypothetical protein